MSNVNDTTLDEKYQQILNLTKQDDKRLSYTSIVSHDLRQSMQGLNYPVSDVGQIVPQHARSIVIALLAAVCMAIASTARGVASDTPFDC